MERVFYTAGIQEPLDRRIGELAGRQHGVLSRAQARELGATNYIIRGRVGAGHWERVFGDVFRVAGSPATWRQQLVASCFYWGAGSLISHRAAGSLWALAGFDVSAAVELRVPRGRKRQNPGHIVHWGSVPRSDRTVVDAISVTTPVRTILDLSSVVSLDQVEEALDDALRRRLTSLARLRWHVAGWARSGRSGVAMIRSLLAARDPSMAPPESVFESRFLRVLKRARLPMPVTQYRVRDGGRLVAVVDFAYPDAKLAIEADGYRWHSGRSRWEHDRFRRNALTLLGWRVIHVTWTDLTRRPDEVIAAIWAGLAAARG